jgi:hypothetical protein
VAASVTKGPSIDITFGDYSAAWDVGATAPKALIATFVGESNGNEISAITYGGKSLTQQDRYINTVGVTVIASVWTYIGGDIPSGSNTLTVTRSGLDNGRTVKIYALFNTSAVSIDETDGGNGSTGTWSKTHNPSPSSTWTFSSLGANNGGHTADTGETLDYTFSNAGRFHYHSSEDVQSDSSRTIGYVGNSIFAGVSIAMVVDTNINVTPSPIEIEIDVPAPTAAYTPNLKAYPSPIVIEVEAPAPTVGITVPRQIPLVGVHHETPGRVARPTGLTTPMLSEEDGVVKFIEMPISVSELDDLSDVTLTSEALNEVLRYNGTVWVNDNRIWRPLMDGSGNVIVDGDGQAVMALEEP